MLAAAPPSVFASASPLLPHHSAMAAAAIAVSAPVLFAPLRPLHNRRRYLDAGTRPSFLKFRTKASLNTVALTHTVSSRKSSPGKIQIRQGGRLELSWPGLVLNMQYQLPHHRQTILYSKRPSSAAVICAAALSSICSAGQTQTVERQSSKTIISILPGMDKTPKLDDGGVGGPPRDGGGGGGGGGGSPSSGGFFLFAFLLFLKFLKDKEKEKKESTEYIDLEQDE